jgi:hypothetical protein
MYMKNRILRCILRYENAGSYNSNAGAAKLCVIRRNSAQLKAPIPRK